MWNSAVQESVLVGCWWQWSHMGNEKRTANLCCVLQTLCPFPNMELYAVIFDERIYIYIYSFLLSAFAQLVCVRPFCHPNFANALHFHSLKLSMKMSSCHWSMRKVTMCCPPTRMFWWPCVVSWMKNICGEYELGVMMLVSGSTSLHICSQIMHSSIFWVLSWAGQVYKCRGVLLENGFSRKCRCC
jgi:hypothetical protein